VANTENKKINLAFYTLNLKISGVYKIISTLTLNMPEIYSVHVFVSDAHESDYIPPFELGGKIHYFNIKDSENKNPLSKIYKNYLRKKLLRKYKIDNNIDLTITFSENPNIHNIITKNKDKVVISIHNFTSINLVDTIRNKFYRLFYEKMIKKYFNKADRIVSVSYGIKEDLKNNYSINSSIIDVLYNPHDLDRINRLAVEAIDPSFTHLFEKTFSIINLGRISSQKGHWYLIRAFRLIKDEIPEAKLIIMGDSKTDILEFIKKLISDLKLDDSVHIVDFQTNPYKFLKNADVYAASSIYEGLPNVLVESLACGTPVVSADCKSGPREILAPRSDFNLVADKIEYAEFGILTPPFKAEMLSSEIPITREEKYLAEAVINIYKDREMLNSYSVKGHERAKEFGIKKTIENYDKLFRDLLKND